MNTQDFNKPVTAAQLNENMYKQFGSKINLDKYTREDLENYRNLLRTKINQTESNSKFNDLLTNETYQRDQYILKVLNTRIKEMLGESIAIMEKAVSKAQQQAAGVALAAKRKGKKPAGKGASAEMAKMSTKELEKFAGTKHKGLPKKKTEKTNEGAKPDFLDVDKDGNKKEPFKKAVKDKKGSAAKNAARGKKIAESVQRMIMEDEEGKAKAITAGIDMINDFTSWMQRVGQYQSKTLVELADDIKSNFGAAEAETFKQAVLPALKQAFDALTQSRETLSSAIDVLAGEAEPGGEPMGMEPEMGAPEEEVPVETDIDSMNAELGSPEDAFAASDAAAGGAETAGRERRESRELFAKKLQESHSIMTILSK